MSASTPARPRARLLTRLGRTTALALATGGLLLTGAHVPAHAASDATWNRLAHCESTGRWSVNTGNGYYGGLQFSNSTWKHFGGTAYAKRADLATRAQQVLIAERTLKGQGWGAWPACTRKLGFTNAMKAGTPESIKPLLGKASAAKAAPQPAAKPAASRSSARTYVVRSGDTLSRIATRQKVKGGWKALYAANRDQLSNPNRIRVGQKLRLP